MASDDPANGLSSAIIIILVFTVILDRPQEMLEDPLGYALTLHPRLRVRECEVYPLVNSGNDHVIGGVSKMAIHADLLNRLGTVVVTGKAISFVPKKLRRIRVIATVTLFAPEV